MKNGVLKLNYSDLAEMITESVKHNLLAEKRSVQSKTLSDMIKEKGKPTWWEADLNSVTDDEIIDIVRYYDIKKPNPYAIIKFKDNTCILVKKTDNNQKYLEKFDKRFNDHNYKVDGKDRYTWHNRDAEEMVFKNPWFKEWDKESQKKAFDNIRKGKKVHDE